MWYFGFKGDTHELTDGPAGGRDELAAYDAAGFQRLATIYEDARDPGVVRRDVLRALPLPDSLERVVVRPRSDLPVSLRVTNASARTLRVARVGAQGVERVRDRLPATAEADIEAMAGDTYAVFDDADGIVVALFEIGSNVATATLDDALVNAARRTSKLRLPLAPTPL